MLFQEKCPALTVFILHFSLQGKCQEFERNKQQHILGQLSAKKQKQTENTAPFISTPLGLCTTDTKFAHMLYYQMGKMHFSLLNSCDR